MDLGCGGTLPKPRERAGYSSTVDARIRVRLFASLADAAGAREIVLEVPPSTPVGAVWALLPEAVHRGAPPPQGVRWALNHHWSLPGAPMQDGDEVAVITPVSGG